VRLLPFPLKGFLYELRRGLLSIPTLAVLVIMLVLSALFLSTIGPPPSPQVEVFCSGLFWYGQGAYHFELSTFDESGKPFPSIQFNLTIFGTGSGGIAPVAYLFGFTGPQGLAFRNATLPAAIYNYTLYTQNLNNTGNVVCTVGFGGIPSVAGVPQGTVQSFGPPLATDVWTTGSYIETNEAHLFLVGPNGTSLSGDQAYWAGPFNTSNASGAPISLPDLPESSMNSLGSFSSPAQTYAFTIPSEASVDQSQGGCNTGGPPIVQIQVFSPSGEVLMKDTNLSACQFAPIPAGPRISAGEYDASNFASSVLDLFVPLMAVFSAYSLYGRDRVSGALESTLSGPISREGLALSRYISSIVALSVAVLVATGVMDLLVNATLGVYLPLSVLGVLWAGLLVAIASFVGLTMLISRLTRSSVILLGIGLGLWGLFGIGWLLFVQPYANQYYFQHEVSNPTNSIIGFATFSNRLELLNPTLIGKLGYNALLTPPVLGVTTWELVAVALLWVVVPLLLFLLLCRIRD
jgi:ABC-type transport system involved in multi-copper enzyme maturation permease subunit